MKKIVSGIILAALVLQLCSCASDSPQAMDSTDAATEAVAETSGYIDELAADWGGETLNIIVQHYSSHPNVPPEEMNGEAVDDALFARDRTVEEKLNISIDYTVYEDRGELRSDVQNAINAGETARSHTRPGDRRERARSAHRRCGIISTEHHKRGHLRLIDRQAGRRVRRVRDLPAAGVV